MNNFESLKKDSPNSQPLLEIGVGRIMLDNFDDEINDKINGEFEQGVVYKPRPEQAISYSSSIKIVQASKQDPNSYDYSKTLVHTNAYVYSLTTSGLIAATSKQSVERPTNTIELVKNKADKNRYKLSLSIADKKDTEYSSGWLFRGERMAIEENLGIQSLKQAKAKKPRARITLGFITIKNSIIKTDAVRDTLKSSYPERIELGPVSTICYK